MCLFGVVAQRSVSISAGGSRAFPQGCSGVGGDGGDVDAAAGEEVPEANSEWTRKAL